MEQHNSSYMGYKEFLEKSERKTVLPGLWKWHEIQEQLDRISEEDELERGRPSVCLINKSTEHNLGVSPNFNAIVQVLEPNKHGKPHRHSNFAIFIVKEGRGYSIIDNQKLEWGVGDVFFAPAWARHEHCNLSETEPAILYTVQDVPTVANQGIWFFRGTEDSDLVHNVKD